MTAVLPATRFPRAGDLRTGLRDSLLLTRLRWRSLRGPRQRVLVYLGVGGVFMALLMASNIGTAIAQLAADTNSDTAAQKYAVVVMSQLQFGHLNGLSAAAFGTAVVASFLSPFTGTANAPLYPDAEIAPLRPNRMHRYTDSLITHMVSAVGFLSLFSLTALASVLTANGGRWVGLVGTWAIWPVLIALGTAEAWLLELVRRRFGPRTLRIGLAALVAGVGVIVLNDRSGAQSLFGLGDFYAARIAAGVRGGFGAIVPLLLVCAVLTLALGAVGIIACHHALRYGDAANAGNTALVSKVRMRMGGGQFSTSVQVVLAQILRHPQVMRPIMAVGLIAIPAVWITAGHGVAVSTVVLGIPIAATISWAVNLFGIIGPGMTWLASTPLQRRTLLLAAITVHAGVIAALFTVCWLPAWLAGRVPPEQMLSVLAGSIVATLMCGRSAFSKSVNRPVRAPLVGTTDTIVPPVRAIGYALRITAWGGQVGIGIFSITNHRWQWLAVLGVALWVAVRYWFLLRKFEKRDVMSKIVATVAAV